MPPARVLRRNLEPPPLRYAAVYVFAIGAVLASEHWGVVWGVTLVADAAGVVVAVQMCAAATHVWRQTRAL